jgi:hypothetical protein
VPGHSGIPEVDSISGGGMEPCSVRSATATYATTSGDVPVESDVPGCCPPPALGLLPPDSSCGTLPDPVDDGAPRGAVDYFLEQEVECIATDQGGPHDPCGGAVVRSGSVVPPGHAQLPHESISTVPCGSGQPLSEPRAVACVRATLGAWPVCDVPAGKTFAHTLFDCLPLTVVLLADLWCNTHTLWQCLLHQASLMDTHAGTETEGAADAQALLLVRHL